MGVLKMWPCTISNVSIEMDGLGRLCRHVQNNTTSNINKVYFFFRHESVFSRDG